jgi:hypothetical protein
MLIRTGVGAASGARRAPWSSPERGRRQALGNGCPPRLWSPARRDGMTACVSLKGYPEYFNHGATETTKHYCYGLALCATRGETEFQTHHDLAVPSVPLWPIPMPPRQTGLRRRAAVLAPRAAPTAGPGLLHSARPGAGLRCGYQVSRIANRPASFLYQRSGRQVTKQKSVSVAVSRAVPSEALWWIIDFWDEAE